MAIAASGAEELTLVRRSWSTPLSVIPLLQRRLADNTLLPGTVRREESDYYVHVVAAAFAAQNKPALEAAGLQTYGQMFGYLVLLDALYRSLNFTFVSSHSLWPAEQLKIVESFVRGRLFNSSSRLSPLTRVECMLVQVFQALDFIPQTAGLRRRIGPELEVVAFVAQEMSPRNTSHRSAPLFFANGVPTKSAACFELVKRCKPVLQTTSRPELNLTLGSARTSPSTGCATAPSPPAPRRRRRSKSSLTAPAVAPWCTAARSTRGCTGRSTRRRAVRSRLSSRLRRKVGTAG